MIHGSHFWFSHDGKCGEFMRESMGACNGTAVLMPWCRWGMFMRGAETRPEQTQTRQVGMKQGNTNKTFC